MVVFVVLMFTTAGLTRSAKSEKERGTLPASEGEEKGEVAEAVGISGMVEDVNKDERKISTRETIKKATRNASKNIKKVLRFWFFIFSSDLLCRA